MSVNPSWIAAKILSTTIAPGRYVRRWLFDSTTRERDCNQHGWQRSPREERRSFLHSFSEKQNRQTNRTPERRTDRPPSPPPRPICAPCGVDPLLHSDHRPPSPTLRPPQSAHPCRPLMLSSPLRRSLLSMTIVPGRSSQNANARPAESVAATLFAGRAWSDGARDVLLVHPFLRAVYRLSDETGSISKSC